MMESSEQRSVRLEGVCFLLTVSESAVVVTTEKAYPARSLCCTIVVSFLYRHWNHVIINTPTFRLALSPSDFRDIPANCCASPGRHSQVANIRGECFGPAVFLNICFVPYFECAIY